MKKFIALTAIAPLAMLAACGDNDAVEQDADATAADTVAVSEEATAADPDANEPKPATKIADKSELNGSYTMEKSDGTKTSVSLDSETNTYEYTGSDGKLMSGKYEFMEDGYRIRLVDYTGGPGIFAWSDGYLVSLADDMELDDSTPVSGDRYQRDDDAMFSREPSIGSPVAPDAGD